MTSRRRDAPRRGSHVRPEPGASPTPPRTRGRRRGAFFFFPLESRGVGSASRRDRGGRRQSRSCGRTGRSRSGVAAAAATGQWPGRSCGLPVAAVAAQTGGAVRPSAAFPPLAHSSNHPHALPSRPGSGGGVGALRSPQVITPCRHHTVTLPRPLPANGHLPVPLPAAPDACGSFLRARHCPGALRWLCPQVMHR